VTTLPKRNVAVKDESDAVGHRHVEMTVGVVNDADEVLRQAAVPHQDPTVMEAARATNQDPRT
jgi:hypothetical protein